MDESTAQLKGCLGLLQLREYTLTETYHEDDVEVEFVSNDNLLANSPTPRGIDPNRDLNEAIAEERREMDTQRYRYVSSFIFFLFWSKSCPRLAQLRETANVTERFGTGRTI